MKAIAAAVLALAAGAVLGADPHPRLADFKELRDYSSWAGYNPEGRNWEYLVFEGKPLKLSARGALSTCQGCHAEQTYTDGLYRSYLSDGNAAAKRQGNAATTQSGAATPWKEAIPLQQFAASIWVLAA